MEKDKKSDIFGYHVNNETCKALSTENKALVRHLVLNNWLRLLKEDMHIIWKKSSLNKQQKHISISITVSSSFIFDYYFHFTLSFPFIPSSVLLSVWTFGVVSRCILNSVCNHGNFVNYYFIIKFLINTFIKICKEQFYVMF